MKNLNSIAQLSDAEFLSFLYSEQNRFRSKESKSGWSVWATLGSIFALVVYVYKQLESFNADVDYTLCYYILCSLLPIVLYFTLLYERARGFENGDSRHIARLSDIAPTGILLYLGVSYLILMVIGLFLKENVVVVCNIISSLPSFMSLAIIFKQRKKLVTTFNSFVVSSNSILNHVMLFLVSGVILIPLTQAVNRLTLAFSVKFEICTAIIVIITLSYVLLRSTFSPSIEKSIGKIIENYLYNDVNKEDSIGQLERLILGNRPTDELVNFFNRLLSYESSIPVLESRLTVIENSLKGKCVGIKNLKDISAEVDKDIIITKELIDVYNGMLARSKELIKLKTLAGDKEFMSLLDLLLNPDTFKNLCNSTTNLQKRMIALLENVTNRCQHLLCLEKECPYRKAVQS